MALVDPTRGAAEYRITLGRSSHIAMQSVRWKIGTHAAVVGASMGGRLAARVLADAHEKVTSPTGTACHQAAMTVLVCPGKGTTTRCCQRWDP